MNHAWPFVRVWLLPLSVGVLIAAHGFAIYGLFSRVPWTIGLAVVTLALLKHMGVFGSIYGFLRRRFRHKS